MYDLDQKISYFWLENPKILLAKNNYLDFFPRDNMTKNQQLNSLSRFSIYLFFIFLAFSRDKYWLYLPIAMFIGIIILYKLESADYREKNIVKNNLKKIKILKKKGKLKKSCQKPTIDNPYMNFLQSDYHENPNRLDACDQQDKEIKKEIDKKFRHNLYTNAKDLFQKKSSERQFFTRPVTKIVNDQKKFANWLYNKNEHCKVDSINCLKYENYKYH